MSYVYEIRIADWQTDASVLRAIRTTVFIQEQQVPEDLEWDEFDSVSLHVLALNTNGEPIGTARLLPDGHIGRMAVLKAWRRRGVGSAMLKKILQALIRRNQFEAQLNAQTTAVGFYQQFGFQVIGEEFQEAGIPHVKMILQL